MKKFILLFVIGLAACVKSEPPIATATLNCDGLPTQIKVFNERIDATIDGEKIAMPQVVSADGAKYQGQAHAGTVGLWNKGDKWSILYDAQMIECK